MPSQVIMAAGCMLHQLPKLLDEFHDIDQTKIRMAFGPSGALRKKIDTGEYCSLFISALSKHTEALVQSEKLLESSILGRNPTVLICRRDLNIVTETALQFITNPRWALGVSTTGFDPDTDEIEILSRVAKTAELEPKHLTARTRLITGGREKPNAPSGRNQYGWIMETQDVDLLLTLHSNAIEAVADNPDLKFIQLPPSIQITGHFGIGIGAGADSGIKAFYHWVLGEHGQKVMARHGFISVRGNHSSALGRGR